MHWVTNENSIAKVAQEYFQNIFATSHPQVWEGTVMLERVQHKISLEMNQSFSQMFTEEEVEKALYQMEPLKSPGTGWFAASVLSIFLG